MDKVRIEHTHTETVGIIVPLISVRLPFFPFSKKSTFPKIPSFHHTYTYMQYNIINHLESTNFRREKKNSEGTRWG